MTGCLLAERFLVVVSFVVWVFDLGMVLFELSLKKWRPRLR